MQIWDNRHSARRYVRKAELICSTVISHSALDLFCICTEVGMYKNKLSANWIEDWAVPIWLIVDRVVWYYYSLCRHIKYWFIQCQCFCDTVASWALIVAYLSRRLNFCEAKVLRMVAFTVPTWRIILLKMDLLLKRSNSFCWSGQCHPAKVNFHFSFVSHPKKYYIYILPFFKRKKKEKEKSEPRWVFSEIRDEVCAHFWLFLACRKALFYSGKSLDTCAVCSVLSFVNMMHCSHSNCSERNQVYKTREESMEGTVLMRALRISVK